jgi:hypothetical protein
MKAEPRLPLFSLLGVGIACALVLLTMGPMSGADPVQAQPPLVVGIDLDPTGNSCPNDGTDCTLGAINGCLETTAGATIEIDVFLEGIPSGESYLVASYELGGWPGELQDPDGFNPLPHAHPLVNLTAQPLSSINDLSDLLPDSSPPYMANIADFGAAEYNPPFTHGVLGRYALDLAGVAANVYNLTLSEVVVGRDVPPGGPLVVDEVWDSNFSPPYGVLAVDVGCPTYADAYIDSMEVLASDCTNPITSMTVATPTDVCLHKILRQDDIATLDVSVSPSANAPVGCTADFSSGPATATLPQNTDVPVDEIYTLNCSDPSTHSFTFGDTIAITTADVIDPNLTNNSDSTPKSLDVTGEADVSVSQQVLASDCSGAAPTELPQGTDVDVCVQKTIHDDGPYTGDVDVSIAKSAVPPGACTANPVSGPLTATVNTSGDTVVDEIWRLNCPNTAIAIDFQFGNQLTVTTTHVTDPVGGNDSDITTYTVDVTATADAQIVSWVFPDEMGIGGNQVLVVPTVAEDIDTTETLDNDPANTTYVGPSIAVGIATTETPDANCSATPDAGNPASATLPLDGSDVVDIHTWSVTLNTGDSCTIGFGKTITITTLQVGEADPSDNTANGSVDLVADTDGDTVPDNYSGLDDNCDDDPNPSQQDVDGDTIGDACDTEGPSPNTDGAFGGDDCDDDVDNDGDTLTDGADPTCDGDGDGVADVVDNCPADYNPGQEDADGDGQGDVCDLDDDNDGVPDASDLCPGTAAADPVDANGCSDAQVDPDADGICSPGAPSAGPSSCQLDPADNCPLVYNPGQEDSDGDGTGDVCEGDADGDTVVDDDDNCPEVDNPDQSDVDEDEIGDACDTEGPSPNTDGLAEGDDCADEVDNDGDGDVDGDDSTCDEDGDAVADISDNCPDDANADQTDTDADGLGDACDPDDDNDGFTDAEEATAGSDPLDADSTPLEPTATPTPTPEETETPEATETVPPAEVCPPVFPGTYNGTIRVDGVPAASGGVVEALIDGVSWGSTVVAGRYALDVPQTLPAHPPCFEGGTITFHLNGATCSPTPEWAAGLQNVDLTCAEAPVPTPTPPGPPGPPTTPGPTETPKATPVAPPPTGGGPLGGATEPWVVGLAAGVLLAWLLGGAAFLRITRKPLP